MHHLLYYIVRQEKKNTQQLSLGIPRAKFILEKTPATNVILSHKQNRLLKLVFQQSSSQYGDCGSRQTQTISGAVIIIGMISGYHKYIICSTTSLKYDILSAPHKLHVPTIGTGLTSVWLLGACQHNQKFRWTQISQPRASTRHKW